MKRSNISLVIEGEIQKKLVKEFVCEFWFAPNDALLRCVETLIWAKRHFTPPVLDIGIGDGRNSKLLFSMNQMIDVGIDKDPKGVNLAKNSGIYKKVEVQDATKMKYKKNCFMSVISNSTFEHIENDLAAVREVSRILKKAGHFFLTVPIPNHERFLRSFGLDKEGLSKYNKRVEHYHYRSINEWKEILKENKLKVIFSKSYMPRSVDRIWYLFHKITTLRLYKRELWSYIKDSPYGKLFPGYILKPILRCIIEKNISNVFKGSGAWVFIIAEKV